MSTDILALVKKLEKYPYLLAHFEVMLEVAENSSGEYELADDVEMKLVEEINKMGQELLETWGANQELKKSIEARFNNDQLAKHSKKKSAGIPDLEK